MPKNLRLGVLAPEFILFPNSDPKYSLKSQTLIFSGHLDMTWAVSVKQFEFLQHLSQRRGGHKSWVTWFRCSWILSTNMGPPLISMKFSPIPNFLTWVCCTTPKWPGTSTNLLVWIHLAPEWSKIFWLPWLISVNWAIFETVLFIMSPDKFLLVKLIFVSGHLNMTKVGSVKKFKI